VSEDLPGFWRFLWLFFMQPITLHRQLRSLGVDPDESLWRILRRRRTEQEDWWVLRSAQMSLIFAPATSVAFLAILAATGVHVSWQLVAIGVAFGVAGGVAGGVALGVAFGVAVGVAGGVALGVASGMAFGVALGVAGGVAYGVAAGVARGVALGVAFGVAFGVALGVAFGVAGGVTFGVAGGVTFGVAAGVAFVAGFFRVPVFLFESIWELAARLRSAAFGRRSLHWAPVLYHELCYLPIPLLRGHIMAEAGADPGLTRRVLEACSIVPGQRRTGRRVEAELRAREITRMAAANDFQGIQELRGIWLPGIQGADAVLLGFSEAARYLTAAQAVFNPHHRLRHLKSFAEQANALDNQLRSHRDVFTQPFEEPLRALREVAQEMRTTAEKDAEGLILNPFRAGDPLSDSEGPELFRGREVAVRDIEDILSDTRRSASLQLLAPRRAGKTSLLKMLPRLLPDTVCVFFDIQAHPIASAGAFWSKLAEQARLQAKRDRRVDLPPLPDGPPMEAAAVWLDHLDQLPGGRRVLITIDEFERLEDLFPGNRQEFLQLMGLFRATIQHRRGVRLLVSGAAPFDELDGVWDDHFISARQIKLPFLDRATSVGLLSEPSPEFPSEAIPVIVAEEVYRQTGGQPFLLQVFGSLLVTRLNDDRRTSATIDDVQAVSPRAIEWAESYFRDAFRSAPPPAHEALARLIRGQSLSDLQPLARRWLAQRYLLTPDDRLAVPLFGTWIEHHALV